MRYFLFGLKNYTVFKGRANRKEYWYFFLFSVIIKLLTLSIPYLIILIELLLLCPTLAVTSRRLHDVNLPGWLCIFILFPLCWLVLIVALAKKGDLDKNKYGDISLV